MLVVGLMILVIQYLAEYHVTKKHIT